MSLISARSSLDGTSTPRGLRQARNRLAGAEFMRSGDAEADSSEILRRRIVSTAAAAVFAAALAAILGWQVRIGFTGPVSGNSFLAPNVAVCFLLASVSLWLLRSGSASGWRLRLARVSAFAMAVVSLQLLVEYVFRLELHVDRTFFQHSLDGRSVRQALTTSIALFLLALSLLLTGRRVFFLMLRRPPSSTLFPYTTLFIGLLGLFAY